ncbi:MAG: Crp/Fnr family transcriptional regulator [bacterium]|nr:Crp/Fnr family transcriptional regulator [bacterium]
MGITELLKQSELFKDISDQHREDIAASGRMCTVKQGEMVFLEGEKGKCLFLCVSGGVKLFKSGGEGREIIVKLVNPGEIFAEVVLYESLTYPVSSVAVSDSQLFSIGRDSFKDLMDNREFRSEFIGFLMRKQRYLAQRILYLTAFDVEERFFRFLLERYGRHYSYEINFSKKDIASVIGTIPETFSRLILRLGKRGIIQWNKTTLTVRDGFWDDEDYD